MMSITKKRMTVSSACLLFMLGSTGSLTTTNHVIAYVLPNHSRSMTTTRRSATPQSQEESTSDPWETLASFQSPSVNIQPPQPSDPIDTVAVSSDQEKMSSAMATPQQVQQQQQ
jgi:hypothetical protein